MKKTSALFAGSSIVSSLAGCASTEQMVATKPNIVIIYTDDQGYNDLGCFGSPNIKTPNIDRMAKEGVKFTSFYAQPICGPSRAALMTGCYPLRVGEVGNQKRLHPMVHPNEIMLPSLLKQAGYATCCIGKWDMNGHSHKFARDDIYPDNFGFDHWYGLPTSNDDGAINLHRNRKVIAKKTPIASLTQRYTKESLKFIEKNKDGPFFLYLPHTMPHTRLDASKKFKGKSKRGLYGDVIQELDWSTGEIIKKLKELGLDKKTLVVYASDNGPWLVRGKHGGSPDPLRDGKTTTWDGGVRVPCVMWGPGYVGEGLVCDEITTTMDILPTFCKLAGVDVPQDRIIDGEDIAHLISGEQQKHTEERTYFYYYLTHLQAVRKGDWKLVLKRPRAPEWCAPLHKASHWKKHDVLEVKSHQLFNLQDDINETRDISEENPDKVNELLELVNKARRDIGDYNIIGKGARFFDEQEKRPDAKKWK